MLQVIQDNTAITGTSGSTVFRGASAVFATKGSSSTTNTTAIGDSTKGKSLIPGVPGGHIMHLHHVRPENELLQLRHAQPVGLLQLPLAHLGLARLRLLVVKHVVILHQLGNLLELLRMAPGGLCDIVMIGSTGTPISHQIYMFYGESDLISNLSKPGR